MIAYLQGGMGNQMFIYATALAASLRLGTDLKLNVSSFDNDPMRQYSLGLWKGVIAPEVREVSEIVREQGMPYSSELVQKIKKDSMLFGYFQTEKYFKEIKSVLKEHFQPRQPLTDRGVETEKKIKNAGNKSVFLTVRRTDYTKSDFHGVLSLEYYQKALALVAERVFDPHVFVFSDEPEWCEENFKLPYKTTIAGNFDRTTKEHLGREDEELWLMFQCRHAVMANSSYSWWGAWLGADETGTVIGPEKWFFKAPEDPKDIMPERWVKL